MDSAIESWWLLVLPAKCRISSYENAIWLMFLLLLTWLVTVLLSWAHSGGPAWGKYWRDNGESNVGVKIIPGPKGFPIFGSLNLMGGLAHRKLAAMAEQCKAQRLMAFSLGETRNIITCHPEVAKDILNSSVFADRPIKESAYSLMFHRAIGFAPYGVYWRTLRKIAATKLFCPKQINGSKAQRFEIAAQMVTAVGTVAGAGIGGFRVREVLKRASLNNMMRSIFGRNYELVTENPETVELSGLVQEGYDLLGSLNWSDHLPWVAGLDLQRVRFRCSKLVPRVMRFVQKIIDEHRSKTGGRNGDFVDVLLSLQGSEKLPDSDMVAVLWEMIFRGTDTVAVLIEWVLARLVLHPEIQAKVHEELDKVVGTGRAVTESDIPALVYLQAVLKEVLRLHPPGPLLSWARLAISDTVIDGKFVPAGTTAIVNMWAITRDAAIWAEPLSFLPERFLSPATNTEFSVMGSDLRLAPFGSGRRSCPGKALGLTMATFWVASLFQHYVWLPCELNPVNLAEVLRLSSEMSTPLTVKVEPRRQ